MSASPGTADLIEAGPSLSRAVGEYLRIADLVSEAGERVVERAEIGAGEKVLDVVAGPGNVAIPAALKGAQVTVTDINAELFAAGRRRAFESEVELEWVVVDPEDLPYEDDSYDHVLSSLGVQFAPRHDVVAAELVRVCRPGGQITLANWAADGYIGRFWAVIARYLPSPSVAAAPPAAWGRVDHVEQLFASHPVDLGFDRETLHFEAVSPEAFVDLFAASYGPLRRVRRSLDSAGRWQELRKNLVSLSAEENLASGKGFQVASDYLMLKAQKRS